LRKFILISSSHSFYPITLEVDGDFAEFAFFGKKKGGGLS
jgi:hypothetical protein